MLHKIKYEARFNLTDRTLSNEVDFEKGFGTITGPNESGKSFLLEMVRWLLFGTGALRGSMTDYAKLKGELTFSIKNVKYTVSRTTNQATLKKDTEVLAVGTKPVNAKIISLFGFGLDVFDIACVVNQMELVKLGQMRPADRKKMVDSVIGLGVIDELRELASTEALAIKREIDASQKGLVEPQKPEAPEGFTTMEEVSEGYVQLSNIKERLSFLKGRTTSVLELPKAPDPITLPLLPHLEAMAKKVYETKSQIAFLKGKVVQKPHASKDELILEQKLVDQDEKYREAVKWLESNPKPIYTVEQLDEIEDAQKRHQVHLVWSELTKQINDLQNNGTFTCPDCLSVSYISQSVINELMMKRDALPSGADKSVEVKAVDVNRHRQAIKDYEPLISTREEMLKVQHPDRKPTMTRQQIQVLLNLWDAYDQSHSYAKQLQILEHELAQEPDYDNMVKIRMRYDIDMENYHKKQSEWVEWKKQYDADCEEVDRLTKELEVLEIYRDLYPKALNYVSALDRYDEDLEKYLLAMQAIASKESYMEQWIMAKSALTDFRVRVKQYLIPSLNVAASSLIQQMTGGQRQRIEVDDDFEVRVDNQPLHTLSGSGMVVANLALRLGLGRVLTNNVFSVFIGDEIDSSMDAVREKNTAQTMQNLCGKVSQVLLITHKYPEADYYIKLGI